MPADRPEAVLFDIDGTLVDSNYAHVEAWHTAFQTVGAPVDAWRIHRDIGMDSDRMLADLLGDATDSLRSEAKHEHARLYRLGADRLRPFEAARELLEGLSDDGVLVVLATSAPAEELALLLDVLDVAPDRFASTNADDVETAKPHPGIVQVALGRAGVRADAAVFVGDTVWDMIAATEAGVPALGVSTGGIGSAELEAAGARRVFEGIDALRDELQAPGRRRES